MAQALIQNGALFEKESKGKQSALQQGLNLQLRGQKELPALDHSKHKGCTTTSTPSQATRAWGWLLSYLPPNHAFILALAPSSSPASPAQPPSTRVNKRPGG